MKNIPFIKRNKPIVIGLLIASAITILGCSDDNPKAKVLLRPVTTMTANLNHVLLNWKGVEGAQKYIVEVYRVTDGANELLHSYETPDTSFSIDLEWDESYQMKVRCEGNGLASAAWDTDVLSLSYPTILGASRTIDTQALITWTKTADFTVTNLTATPLDKTGSETGEAKVYPISNEVYEAQQVIIDELQPSTSYKICAYSGDVSLDNYRGRTLITTGAAEDLVAEYGANLIDLREAAYDEQYFNNLDWSTVAEGTAFILPEGKSYIVNSGTVPELTKSFHFVTPQTLGEYATLKFDNAFRVADGAEVKKITFKRMNLTALKTMDQITDGGMSGKQVVCPEAATYYIDSIKFTDCHIENFRAVVRSKSNNGSFGNIVFQGCSLNAIGNQGIVSTDGKTGKVTLLTFNECTVTNICGIADLRNADSSTGGVAISNCTFCYAPMDNSFLFRVAYGIPVTIQNSVFGASMKVNGKAPAFNEAGTGGQDDYTGRYPFAAVNSFKASDHASTKGDLGLTSANMTTSTLFQDPANGNFKLHSTFSANTSVGASKWRAL